MNKLNSKSNISLKTTKQAELFKSVSLSANNKHTLWKKPPGAALSLAMNELKKNWQGPIVYVASNTRLMNLNYSEQLFFQLKDEHNTNQSVEFPDWENLAYDYFSPHKSLISQRLKTLHDILDNNQHLIINTHVDALLQRLPPSQFIQAFSFDIRIDDTIIIDQFRLKLEQGNYLNVSQVVGEGEFSIRGGLIDVFPMGSRRPYRMDLFDDIVDNIRIFDPKTQQSLKNVEHLKLLPGNEFPLNEQSIEQFKRRYRLTFDGDLQDHIIYQQMNKLHTPAGIEYYFPLFFEQTATIFDYLPDNTLFIHDNDLLTQAQASFAQIEDRFDRVSIDKKRPPLPVEQLYINPQQLFDQVRQSHTLDLISQSMNNTSVSNSKNIVDIGALAKNDVFIDYKQTHPHQAFIDYINASKHKKLLIVCETIGRKESLLEILSNYHIRPKSISNWQEFLQTDTDLAICHGEIERGLRFKESKISIDKEIELIAEPELYQDKIYLSKDRRKAHSHFASQDAEAIIRSLDELKINDPVVHIEHGVGRYRGLETIQAADIKSDYLLLEYAGNSKLYVPVLSLHLINRYTGGNPDTSPLHTLGTNTWSEQKKKAQQKAYDMAAELLETQALRELSKGMRYKLPEKDYGEFCDAFAYEETEDQTKTISAIIDDMASEKNMDRLVCGDVGFGKTEVAMRAAFIAAYNKKQVCMLVPTTLLAQQHYESFLNRFANHAVNIGVLSRLRSIKETRETLEKFATGEIDILIGTHKLLQKDFLSKDLGLIIIDEEHRFGVRQKEILKRLAENLDLLTLTATPIPRTLNQAMNKIRDISLIATPPKDRIAVKTFVQEFNQGLIIEAVNRELHRGGQVYFLHNEVRTMMQMAATLEKWFPQANIGIAHGQMHKRDLESAMQNFYHQRYQIFLCTTIIENGIDNPHANTILINKADHFGLSQLHQLRGRVGRSNHQAYAYCLVESERHLSDDAKKRLDAIVHLDELGAGFMLASHDLEIRGAGEILGEAQSGALDTVGLHLYTTYIQQAIKTLGSSLNRPLKSNGKSKGKSTITDQKDKISLEDVFTNINHPKHCEINLNESTIIPDDYINDVHLRLVFYKRIAACKDDDQLREIQIEMIDRFGLLPDEIKRLISVTQLKMKAQILDIKQLLLGTNGGSVHFHKNANINPENIIMLVQSDYKTFQFKGSESLLIKGQYLAFEDKVKVCQTLFNALGKKIKL